MESSQELEEKKIKKVDKTFKKFARALNDLYRKEGEELLTIKIDAEIFNDLEMRWGWKLIKNLPACVHGKPFRIDSLSGYDCKVCQGKYIKRMNIANGVE